MKPHHYFLSAAILVSACDKQNLDRDTAKELIIAEYKLPEVVDHSISAGDPTVAKKLLDLGFEKDGLVKIMRKQTFNEMGMPWIQFTEKGKAYFLPTPEEDIRYQGQNVKLASKEFDQIKGIVMGKDNNTALVEFSVSFKDPTPFAKLSKDLSGPKVLKAFFIKYDSGWKIDNKKGAYMLMEF